MRVKRYFAPHLIHELLRCYASLRFAPVGAEQTSTGCLAPRNSTHIRNPLIFQGKSQGHQSKIDDSPHVCAGQQVRALILQAGTSSDLLTLVSYHYKESEGVSSLWINMRRNPANNRRLLHQMAYWEKWRIKIFPMIAPIAKDRMIP